MATEVTRTIEEQLSAFLDGELPDEELQLLVRRLERDEDYRATLARYSMIGSIIRDEPVYVSSMKFRSKVMAQIEHAGVASGRTASGGVARGRWIKPFASAAAVAVVLTALLNSGLFNSATETPAGRQSSAPARIAADSVSTDARARQLRQIRRQSIQADELDRERLRSYMVSHREYARSFQGPIGNSRIFVKQVNFEE